MHNKPKEFFCKVCNSYLCGDCLFEEFRSQTPKHKSHQIITITEKFTETKKAIKEKLHLFNPKIEDIKSVCYEILKNIGILTKSKDEISIDMYSQFATLEKRIDDAFFKYDKSLNDQIKQLQLIQNEIDSILQRLQLYLLDDSLVDFSSISTSLESAEKVETLLSTLEIPHSFPSIDNELLPQYSSVKICIPNFIETVERFRQLDDTSIRFFYSDKIKIGGNLWRAKIYPNGNGNGVNTHLSVFVELLDGYTEPSTYYYKMEIFGCKNDVPPLVRQYASTFVKMDSWGWNKAAALSKIINGDYIGEDGGLCIQLSIKPESYFQENRDLHHALEKKRKKLEKLKKLKEMCEHKE
ncbi:B-box zinc finger family protein [Histomonas meleagridis]|uniref:B-box zinc finger family protein n=1 Tax=Histomonas meleagridis TaxID=135588 RepID=UPI00355A5E38|nr:B-box zinc finger family protein [Histomonas meleagridis]KAH0804397.1 B-box zinc finger family protein [Histomonas meleagridis]